MVRYKLRKTSKYQQSCRRFCSALNTIQFSQPALGNEEIVELSSTITSGRLVMGPKVKLFEELVAKHCGQKHAVAVTSGTSALTLAMSAYGIDMRWSAVVPAYTWVATYNAGKMLGASIRLADVCHENFCMVPFSAKNALMKCDRDKSIVIPVHLFGNRCPAPEGNFDVILGDGCCSFAGVDSDSTTCGSWNDVQCFSFHPRKLVTTGEGGMVVCSDDSFATKLKLLRDHGAYRSPEQRKQTVQGGDMTPDFPIAGYNFRMTDLQGGLGVAQMARLQTIIDLRHSIANIYDCGLADYINERNMKCLMVTNTDGENCQKEDTFYLQLPISEKPNAKRVLTMYAVQLRSKRLDDLWNQLQLCSGNLDLCMTKRLGDNMTCNCDVIAANIVREVNRLKLVKEKIMKDLINMKIIVRPPMISLLEVNHVQEDHFAMTAQDLKKDEVKARYFPGTYMSSNLTFALPLHPLMSLQDAERVVYSVRKVSSQSNSSLTRSLSLSATRPHDFTLQYPVRREYFANYFKINQIISDKIISDKIISDKIEQKDTTIQNVETKNQDIYQNINYDVSKKLGK